MQNPPVLISEDKNVVYITLNRPEAHNALNPEMMDIITKRFKKIPKEKSVRAVVIKAEGPSFCAGGDLNWMRKSIKYNLAQNRKDAERLSKMYESIFDCPVPVLALAHGNIFGGGLGLIAVCDIVAADSSARFCFSELRIGVVPSMIATYVLRKMPESQARQLFLTAELFEAPKAREVGLIHFYADSAGASSFIQEKLQMILNNAPEGTRVTKFLIHAFKKLNREQARKLSIKTIAERRVSQEGQEGLNSFFEKRKPSWRNS